MLIAGGVCKAKDWIKTIALSWYGIGGKWEFDETDMELISKN